MNYSSPIPNTAPFAEEEIEILNRVVGPASPTQRAWLAGFLDDAAALGETLRPSTRASRKASRQRNPMRLRTRELLAETA